MRKVFVLFNSIFLKNRSLTNGRGFYGEKRKIGKRNLYLSEDQLSRNEIWCATDKHSYTCHVCAKGFLDSNFNEAVIDKVSNFHEIAPKFTYSQKSYFLSTIGFFFRPTAPFL